MNLKLFQKSIFIFLFFGWFSIEGFGQNQVINDSAEQKLIMAAKEIIASTRTCVLITSDEEGRPRARVMDAFPPETDFTVWFGTNPKSRKVNQIKKDSRVTLYYQDKDDSGYVVIHGNAVLVDDAQEKKNRWKLEWEAFYPDYPNDFLLIKVTPEWMEVVSYAYGITGDSVTWEPPHLLFEQK